VSAPRDVVWREDSWPKKWVGMHYHHAGGIRCDSRKEAEEFMRDLCGRHGCAWVEVYR